MDFYDVAAKLPVAKRYFSEGCILLNQGRSKDAGAKFNATLDIYKSFAESGDGRVSYHFGIEIKEGIKNSKIMLEKAFYKSRKAARGITD